MFYLLCRKLFQIIIFSVLITVALADSTEELAKKAQNPVANLISLPFQNNTNFDVGSSKQTQNILNIQPVIPFNLSQDWNLITRTIVPLIWQPTTITHNKKLFGLGDINPSFFFSPVQIGKIIWGVGPAFFIPTETNPALGTGKWSAGPAFVVLTMPGHWVFGVIANNVWSFAGSANRRSVNQMTTQPFINYNFSHGWYINSSPIITANWNAARRNIWVLPVGGGIGKIVKLSHFPPMNIQVNGYYNLLTPEQIGSTWTLRVQLQFLFPT